MKVLLGSEEKRSTGLKVWVSYTQLRWPCPTLMNGIYVDIIEQQQTLVRMGAPQPSRLSGGGGELGPTIL
jgi:hypothetical protein